MDGSTTLLAWAVVAGLGYFFVSCSLRALALHLHYQVQLHDCVRKSKLLRLEYQRAVTQLNAVPQESQSPVPLRRVGPDSAAA